MPDLKSTPEQPHAPRNDSEQLHQDDTAEVDPVSTMAALATEASDILIKEGSSHKSKNKVRITAEPLAAGIIALSTISGAFHANNTDNSTAPHPPTSEKAIAAEEKHVTFMTLPNSEIATEHEHVTHVVIPDIAEMTDAEALDALIAAGLQPASLPDFDDRSDTAVLIGLAIDGEEDQTTTTDVTAEEAQFFTLAQRNAIDKAQSYLRFAGFSRAGLISQLKFEGYSDEDATFGVDNAGFDWNAECAEKAQNYMEMASFSRQALYDQFASEGFEPTEIEYALAAVGY